MGAAFPTSVPEHSSISGPLSPDTSFSLQFSNVIRTPRSVDNALRCALCCLNLRAENRRKEVVIAGKRGNPFEKGLSSFPRTPILLPKTFIYGRCLPHQRPRTFLHQRASFAGYFSPNI